MDESNLDVARRVLTEKQWQVWALREFQGVGWKQMSVMLGVSSATVRETYKVATRKVGQELARVEDQDSTRQGPHDRGAAPHGGDGAA